MKVLRWIAVLPGAIAASFIAYAIGWLISNWCLSQFIYSPHVSTWFSVGGIIGIIVEAICSIITGTAFVYAGSFIAPDYQKTTSIVLTTLGIVICTMSLLIQIFVIGVVDWHIIIGGIATSAGCINGAFQFHKEEEGK